MHLVLLHFILSCSRHSRYNEHHAKPDQKCRHLSCAVRDGHPETGCQRSQETESTGQRSPGRATRLVCFIHFSFYSSAVFQHRSRSSQRRRPGALGDPWLIVKRSRSVRNRTRARTMRRLAVALFSRVTRRSLRRLANVETKKMWNYRRRRRRKRCSKYRMHHAVRSTLAECVGTRTSPLRSWTFS